MRGIKPNKKLSSFSPHPSCLRDASAIHLPARSIAASPLWLKTVTCGLFLRCFTPPRRAPEGEGLTGHVHVVISSVAEKSPAVKTASRVSAPAKCPRWLTAEKSPAEKTRTSVHDHQNTHLRPPKNLPREGGYPLPDPSSVATRQITRGTP